MAPLNALAEPPEKGFIRILHIDIIIDIIISSVRVGGSFYISADAHLMPPAVKGRSPLKSHLKYKSKLVWMSK